MVTSSAVVGSSAIRRAPGCWQDGDGDGHPLPHAAAELVRVGAEPLVGAGNADEAERVAGAAAGLGAADALVGLHGLDHLRVDAQDRVQRHHRVLEDHRDVAAAKPAHVLIGQPGNIAALEQDLAGHDPARRVDQAEQGEAGDGLARPALADQAHHLPALDGERHVVDGAYDPGAGEEMGGEAADGEGRRAHRRSRGFSTSRNWSPTRLMATIVMSSATPG